MRKDNLIVDGFAGGGGASTGIEMALGRPVDIAINHDPDAILMHMTNHPDTVHIQEDIWHVKPLEATKGRHVALLWMSPDCKHFSKAKGGKPKDKNIRALPWAIVMWAKQVRPDVIIAENVEEIQTWGPLDKNGYPIPEKKGQTFNLFIESLKKLGYIVEWRELVAADYGAPTTRKRWYMIARCDGRPIIWPEPTHSKNGENGLKKWVPVSTVLNFSDLGKSIFDRKKPLAKNTLKRIAKGLEKFVFNNPEPFIMQIGQTGFTQDRNRSVNDPLSTIVTKNEHCLVTPILAPYMVTVNHSGAKHHYCNSLDEPLKTITQKHGFGIVAPMLIQYHSETSKDSVRGQSVSGPLMTVDASPRYALVSSFLSKFYRTCVGQSISEPLHTITTSQGHFGQVTILTTEKDALLESLELPIKDQNIQNNIIHKCNQVAQFIIEYYGQSTAQPVDEPLHTIVTKDRFALVTIFGVDYIICDIKLRMLTPKELYKAQGFPDDYIIDHDYTGKKYPISKQVEKCGNSVVPIIAQKLVEANCSHLKVGERIGNMRIDDSEQQLKFA